MAIILGIPPKQLLGGLHGHLQMKVILFKPRTMDEACVHAQYLEKIGYKKG
jgi:hypothetical protein